MNINELSKECHEIALSKGWYDGRKRGIPELIMLIVTELSEAVEADRNGKYARHNRDLNLKLALKPENPQFKTDFKSFIKDTFEDEIADAFIRLFDMCGYLNIDIEKHIRAKIEYNKTREYKHGKRY